MSLVHFLLCTSGNTSRITLFKVSLDNLTGNVSLILFNETLNNITLNVQNIHTIIHVSIVLHITYKIYIPTVLHYMVLYAESNYNDLILYN